MPPISSLSTSVSSSSSKLRSPVINKPLQPNEFFPLQDFLEFITENPSLNLTRSWYWLFFSCVCLIIFSDVCSPLSSLFLFNRFFLFALVYFQTPRTENISSFFVPWGAQTQSTFLLLSWFPSLTCCSLFFTHYSSNLVWFPLI